MGYFSNGTEASAYEARYCSRCCHEVNPDGTGCVVMTAHQIFNYDECNNPESILHILIPRDGITNGRCRMFIAKGLP